MFEKIEASATRNRVLALLTAWLIALGPNVPPAFAEKHGGPPATPIQHLVVVFQENVSFDHYFGTYPNATNPPGEPQFHAKPGTPTVNGYTNALFTNNPNLNPLNGSGAANPFRLDRSQAVTSRSGPRLYGRATGVQQGCDGPISVLRWHGGTASFGRWHHQHEWPEPRLF